MTDAFSRTELLIGEDALLKLKNAKILLFGLGGVGSYVLEALARCAIGEFHLVDFDKIDITNINRQIIALKSSIGEYKTEIAKKRVLDINENAKIFTYPIFFNEEKAHLFDFKNFDYIIDAIDNVSAKIAIIENAFYAGTKIISSMGTGNKLNPMDFEIGDIYKTSVCPLARKMRVELKKRGIKKLKVLYSKEIPKPKEKNSPTMSISFVPSSAGLIIASEVVKDIIFK